MYKIAPPTTSGSDSFGTAVATIRSISRRKVFLNAAEAIDACCDTFDHLASTAQLDSAVHTMFETERISTDEMVGLYEKQFLGNQGTQPIRDSLKNSAPLGLCPYCGEGSVYELDHFLPKRPFGTTAVHPANLVPACRDCNRVKGDFAPTAAAAAVLHPYFATAFDFRWLYASLARTPSGLPAVAFEVRLAEAEQHLKDTLNSHMKVFHLFDRFKVLGAQTLNNFETLVRSPIGRSMDRRSATRHLLMDAVQQSGGRTNSWEAAVLQAMASDDWYLSTYLRLT